MDDLSEALLEPRPRTELSRIVDNLSPLADAIAETLRDERFLIRMETATPAEREEVNRLRAILAALAGPIQARLAALDQHVLIAATRVGADQLPLPKGRAIRVVTGEGRYEVDAHDLRDALTQLAHETNVLTVPEVEDAVRAEVSYKPNHAKLNYLARHRGAAVTEAINTYRRRVPPDPSRGKVEWPEPLREEE